MNTKTHSPLLLGLLTFLTILTSQLSTFAQATVSYGFSYQGRLNNGANPANGIYDLRFDLYSQTNGTTTVAGLVTNTAVAVSNGLFTTTVDFSNYGFPWTGLDRFLEIAVRTNGSGAFSILTPRQKITPAPQALFSTHADLANSANQLNVYLPASQLSGTLTSAQLGGTYANAVTLNNAANSFTGSGAGLTGVTAANLAGGTYGNALTLNNAANSFTGSGAGLTGVNAALLGGQVASAFVAKTGGTMTGALNLPADGLNVGSVGSAEFQVTGGRTKVYGDTVPDLFNLRSKATSGTWLQLFSDTTGGNTWSLISSASGNAEGAGNLLFNNGATRMMLNGSGQLGLGSTSPLGMLEIQGGADTTGLNDPHALALAYHNGGFRHWISSRHNSAATGNAIDFYLNTSSSSGGSSAPGTGNAPILTLANQGVGIGTTTPAATLDVAGNINASGNATFNNMPGVNISQGSGMSVSPNSKADINNSTINIPANGYIVVTATIHVHFPNEGVTGSYQVPQFDLVNVAGNALL